MTTLFNFRANRGIKTQVSNKVWKITRKGMKRRWGRAVMTHRRPKLVGKGHELVTHFKSDDRARKFLRRIVAEKISEGYDKLRRRKS